MRKTLEDIRAKLVRNIYKNEEHVRLSLVTRIVHELGWNVWDPNEVNSEFIVARDEDKTRVDLALFLTSYEPTVFMEIKAVGRLEDRLHQIERQLRDYNRNLTAIFSIITDGQKWRFYYSQTGGKFSQKCFKTLDILSDNLDELTLSFETFLSKAEIENGNAQQDAKDYLQLSHKQRVLEDALPKARQMIVRPPFPSLPKAVVQLATEAGVSVTIEEAVKLIKQSELAKPSPEVPSNPTIRVQQSRTQHGSKSKRESYANLNRMPPDGTVCKFKYKGTTYQGEIENGSLVIPYYGNFPSFSGASRTITETKRLGTATTKH